MSEGPFWIELTDATDPDPNTHEQVLARRWTRAGVPGKTQLKLTPDAKKAGKPADKRDGLWQTDPRGSIDSSDGTEHAWYTWDKQDNKLYLKTGGYEGDTRTKTVLTLNGFDGKKKEAPGFGYYNLNGKNLEITWEITNPADEPSTEENPKKLREQIDDAVAGIEDLVKKNPQAGKSCSAQLTLFRDLTKEFTDILKKPRPKDDVGQMRQRREAEALAAKWQKALGDIWNCLTAHIPT